MIVGGRRTEVPGWALVLLATGAAILLFLVRDILPPFIVAGVLAYLLVPVVARVERYFRLSRLGGALMLLLIALTPLSIAWFWVLPPLVRDTQDLAAALPVIAVSVFEQFFGGAVAQIGVAVPAKEAAQVAIDVGRDLLGTPAEPTAAARAAVGFYAGVFLALVVLAYLVMDGERLARAVLGVISPELRERLRLAAKEVDRAVLRYAWGLAILSTVEFAFIWLVYGALYGLPYALPVAMVTALLGLVPFVGPLTASILAAVVALGRGSLELAVAVVVFYYLYRIVERQLLLPRLVERSLAPHPLVTIFAALLGATLAGLFGALLAIPLAAGLKVFVAGWQASAGEQDEATSAELTVGAGRGPGVLS